MPVDDSTLTKRYALRIALIYLLMRCIPDLVLYVVTSLPAETFTTLTENHGVWLRHVYPVMPVPLINVPLGFQQALALLPVLVIEALLVFCSVPGSCAASHGPHTAQTRAAGSY